LNRFPFFGLLLIIVGALLLRREFHLFYFSWHIVGWGLLSLWGAFSFIQGFSKNEGGKVFFGTAAILFGLYNILRTFDFIEIHYHTFLSIVFIILGFSFLTTTIAEKSLWLLLPTLFFGGVGTVLLLDEYGYIDSWDIWNYAHMFWPIVIILFGLLIVLRSSRRKSF